MVDESFFSFLYSITVAAVLVLSRAQCTVGGSAEFYASYYI